MPLSELAAAVDTNGLSEDQPALSSALTANPQSGLSTDPPSEVKHRPTLWKLIRWKILGAVGVVGALILILSPKQPSDQSNVSPISILQTAPPQPVNGTVGDSGITVCPTLQAYDSDRYDFEIWREDDSGRHYTTYETVRGVEIEALENEEAMDAESNGCIRVQHGIVITVVNVFNEADDLDPNDAIARVIVSMSDGSKFKGFAENAAVKEKK